MHSFTSPSRYPEPTDEMRHSPLYMYISIATIVISFVSPSIGKLTHSLPPEYSYSIGSFTREKFLCASPEYTEYASTTRFTPGASLPGSTVMWPSSLS